VSARLIVDTGPLVAFFSKTDTHHAWVARAWKIKATLVTCDAVITEAAFLLQRRTGLADLLLQFVEEGAMQVQGMGPEIPAVRRLMRRYSSVPMSFADACLVRMSELDAGATITTCDSDFTVYRRLGRQVIPLLAPFG
jgi:predicted nucleic acid-binding protein